jgi:hypothetical protein
MRFTPNILNRPPELFWLRRIINPLVTKLWRRMIRPLIGLLETVISR